MGQTIRLLIVDDHPALRCGLVALLQREPDFTVVGEASNGIEAVDLAFSLKPNVILMDLALPKKSGLQAIHEIHAANADIRILIFTSFSDGEKIIAGIKAGAIGYLIKDSTPQELFNAIRSAAQGKPALNDLIGLSLLHQIQHNQQNDVPSTNLTEREVEILRWMAQGMSNPEIAEKACITEGTVRSHVSNLLSKLGLQNRAQAVIYAVRKGLVDIDKS